MHTRVQTCCFVPSSLADGRALSSFSNVKRRPQVFPPPSQINNISNVTTSKSEAPGPGSSLPFIFNFFPSFFFLSSLLLTFLLCHYKQSFRSRWHQSEEEEEEEEEEDHQNSLPDNISSKWRVYKCVRCLAGKGSVEKRWREIWRKE